MDFSLYGIRKLIFSLPRLSKFSILAQKHNSQEIIELSDDEDTTLTINPMPPQPRPMSAMRPGPSRSPVKAAFSQLAATQAMKRPNGMSF